MCGDDQVNADGTCKLRDPCDRCFNFFTGGHDQIGKLVDDDNDIRKKFMSVVRIEFTEDKLRIVLLDVSDLGLFQ